MHSSQKLIIFANEKKGKTMTTTQINAEIYQNLGYLADSEDYMKKVLTFLKKLSLQKRSASVNKSTKKIVVDMSRPLPTDKYVGIISSSREDDEKAKEQYMKEKYGRYL